MKRIRKKMADNLLSERIEICKNNIIRQIYMIDSNKESENLKESDKMYNKLVSKYKIISGIEYKA